MKVRVTADFYDVTEDLKLRKKGEEIEVNKDRADHLLLRGLVETVEAPPAEPKKKSTKQNQ